MGASAYNIHYFSSVHKVVHQKVRKVVVHKVAYQAFGLNSTKSNQGHKL